MLPTGSEVWLNPQIKQINTSPAQVMNTYAKWIR